MARSDAIQWPSPRAQRQALLASPRRSLLSQRPIAPCDQPMDDLNFSQLLNPPQRMTARARSAIAALNFLRVAQNKLMDSALLTGLIADRSCWLQRHPSWQSTK